MNLEMFLKYGDKYNQYFIWMYDEIKKEWLDWTWSANGGDTNGGIFGKPENYWKVLSYKIDYDLLDETPLCIIWVIKDDKIDNQYFGYYNHFPSEILEGENPHYMGIWSEKGQTLKEFVSKYSDPTLFIGFNDSAKNISLDWNRQMMTDDSVDEDEIKYNGEFDEMIVVDYKEYYDEFIDITLEKRGNNGKKS